MNSMKGKQFVQVSVISVLIFGLSSIAAQVENSDGNDFNHGNKDLEKSGGVLALKPGIQDPRDLSAGELEDVVWTVDLTEVSRREAVEKSEHMSRRLMKGHGPVTFKTDFEEENILGVQVYAASRTGAALKFFVDGDLLDYRKWPSADSTTMVETIFYLTIPAGKTEIVVDAPDDTVVIDRYFIAPDPDVLPGTPSKEELTPLNENDIPMELRSKADGYKGIWFTLGKSYEYGDKYSGGLGTYTAKHIPLAVYAPEADKTFFVYGGTKSREERHLLIMASEYDHADNVVPRPTIVHDRQGVDDPHDNPSISLDDDGYVWIFISGRGRRRQGVKYRSKKPYSVEEFEMVTEQEMTYPQPWYIEGKGFMHLFTKYSDGRELYWETSSDGYAWSEDQKLAGFGGHYQMSKEKDGKIITAFNWHENGSVDQRTNIYYLETSDMGETWTTVDGTPQEMPLESPDNDALVIDYAEQDRLVYLNDMAFDKNGNPILQYVTSAGHQPGPAGEPRNWKIAHWTGEDWQTYTITDADHNYDMGSLYVEDDTWTLIGPTETGPQKWQCGGEMAVWVSENQGESWSKTKQITENSEFNHTYARAPLNAADPFYVFWADGDPAEISPSRLYFSNSAGEYWKLPYNMKDEHSKPLKTD